MSAPLLETKEARLTFDGGPPLFDGLDMSLDEGEIVVVRGPSGGGKSTLLRCLCRLQEFDSGQVLYRGADIRGMDPPRLRRELSYLQQNPTLVDATVRDNLLLPFTFAVNADLSRPQDAELRRWLSRMLLPEDALGRQAATLSQGQKQRVCLIRALLLEPAVLLMDEPTSALDEESSSVVLRETRTVNKERGVAVVFVTHGESEGLGVDSRVLTIKAGKAVWS